MSTNSLVQPRWVTSISFVLLLALAAPALWFLFVYGYPRTHDGDLHLIRQALLDYYVHHGVWYPRWISELFLGYGYPLFTFYGPATYYLGELFVLAGFSVAQALVFASAFLVVVGGIGMILFATNYFQSLIVSRQEYTAVWLPTLAGLVAGVAYMYAPYLLVNLYMRGALGELGAMALWPWVLWSCRRLMTANHPTNYTFVASLILGLMIITHTITLLLAPPIVLAYVIFLAWQRRKSGQLQHNLRSLGAAVGIALGLSCFFWLPLFVERVDLNRLAYNARFMPSHVWDWQTFLDGTLRFVYTGLPPQQIGLVQLSLVLLGLISFWRLGSESRFWLIISGVLVAAICRPTLPLWVNSDIGLTIQFPWRLLGVLSFSFALITGATISWIRRPWLQASGATLVIALIIFANQPRLAQLDFHNAQDVDLSFDVVATFEQDSQAWGAGWSREFLPKWAAAFARFEPKPRGDEDQESILTTLKTMHPVTPTLPALTQLAVTMATPDRVTLNVQADTAAQLQLNQFYFPGWQATDGAGHALSTLPAPDTGFLTIAVPAGTKQITINREVTPVEQWAGWLTIATLVGYTGWLLCKGRHIGQGLVVLALVITVSGARWLPFAVAPAQFKVTTATPYHGLALVGYRMEIDDLDGLLLFPYWFVRHELPDLQMTWQLIDATGTVVSSTTVQPYYNTGHSSVWTAGTLVRDGYRLPLPPGLPAGNYQLVLAVQSADQDEVVTSEAELIQIGEVTLATPTAQLAALHSLNLVFTLPKQVTVWLHGYTIAIEPQLLDWRSRASLNNYLLAYPGDHLVARLYWRAAGAAEEGYHSFIHLVDHQRQTLVAQDQLAGSALNSSLTWNPYHPQRETYTLSLPRTAASGLYYPRLGLYTFEDQDRFIIEGADGTALGDGYDLPPIKVLNPADMKSLQPALVTFGDFAQLIDVAVLPETGVKAGETLTVSLTYQTKATTMINYTQFLHLAQTTPALGTVMAAQFDVQPRQGANPTSAWVPGEVITDQLLLTVADGTPAGRYQLLVGLYDGEGTRSSVTDADGNVLPDAAAILDEIEVK